MVNTAFGAVEDNEYNMPMEAWREMGKEHWATPAKKRRDLNEKMRHRKYATGTYKVGAGVFRP